MKPFERRSCQWVLMRKGNDAHAVRLGRRRAAVLALLSGILDFGCSPASRQQPNHADDAPEDRDDFAGIDHHKAVSTIDLSREREGLVVSWKDCGGSPEASLDILVVDRLGTFSMDCYLEHIDRSHPRLNGRWVYGFEPAGYELGACKPLEPGVEYGIIVDGDADGFSSFRVLPDGTIEKICGWCSRDRKAGSECRKVSDPPPAPPPETAARPGSENRSRCGRCARP